MITAPEIEAMAEDLIRLYDRIEQNLVKNVARRIAVQDAVTKDTVAAWQMDKLSQMGALRQDNIRALAKHAKKTDREIARIIAEAGFKTLANDEAVYQMAFSEGVLPFAPTPVNASPAMKQIIDNAIGNTRIAMNLVNTSALESADSAFRDVINQTYLETSLGITDYNSAIRKSCRQLADKGITGATYVSEAGRITRNHLEVAVRRNIITSSSQTAGRMQIARAKEWGANLVEVTSHMGARPEHAAWQGKIYSIEGGTRQYPNLTEVTGYGSVTGLKGANCYHDFYPFFPGISEKIYQPYPKDENAKAYEEAQQQRKLERDIRKQKRRILVADETGDEKLLKRSQLALKDKEAALADHADKTGRYRRRDREQVMGFGRSEAAKASWAKRKS